MKKERRQAAVVGHWTDIWVSLLQPSFSLCTYAVSEYAEWKYGSNDTTLVPGRRQVRPQGEKKWCSTRVARPAPHLSVSAVFPLLCGARRVNWAIADSTK